MKTYRLAVIAGIISTLCLISSYYYYTSTLSRMEYNERKYHTIMSTRSERADYRKRVDAFVQRWKGLGELSEEKAANVNYEIALHPADFDELNEKVLSTYAHGFFFLKDAVLETTPEGLKLSVTGFKRGENHP